MVISALSNKKQSLLLIKEAFGKKINDDMIVPVMGNCAVRKNENAVKLIDTVFVDPKKSKDFFALAIWITSKRKNIEALKTINKVCPEDSRPYAFLVALKKIFSDPIERIEHLKILFEICPEDEKKIMFANLLYNSVVDNFPDGISLVHEICPKDIKVEMFARSLVSFTDDIDLLHLISEQKFTDIMRERILAQAFVISANKENEPIAKSLKKSYLTPVVSEKAKNEAVFPMVKKYHSEREQKRIFAQALVIAAKQNKSKAIQKIKSSCSEDMQESIFAQALVIATKEDNSEAIQKLKSSYSEDMNMQESIFAQALVIAAKEDNSDVIQKIKSSCSEDMQESIFAQALVIWVKENNTDAIKKMKSSCSEDMQENIFAQALVNAAKEKNETAIKKITKIYPKEKQVDMYAEALATCMYKSIEKALSNLVDACPDDIITEALFKAPDIYKEKKQFNHLLGDFLAMGTPINCKQAPSENAADISKTRADIRSANRENRSATMKP